MVKWRGLFKVRIIKAIDTDKQNCLVEALENYGNIKKGEQWITRSENLEVKKYNEDTCVMSFVTHFYYYPTSSRVDVPRGVVKLLSLKHGDLVEVAIRPIDSKGCQERYGYVPKSFKKKAKK